MCKLGRVKSSFEVDMNVYYVDICVIWWPFVHFKNLVSGLCPILDQSFAFESSYLGSLLECASFLGLFLFLNNLMQRGFGRFSTCPSGIACMRVPTWGRSKFSSPTCPCSTYCYCLLWPASHKINILMSWLDYSPTTTTTQYNSNQANISALVVGSESYNICLTVIQLVTHSQLMNESLGGFQCVVPILAWLTPGHCRRNGSLLSWK